MFYKTDTYIHKGAKFPSDWVKFPSIGENFPCIGVKFPSIGGNFPIIKEKRCKVSELFCFAIFL